MRLLLEGAAEGSAACGGEAYGESNYILSPPPPPPLIISIFRASFLLSLKIKASHLLAGRLKL